LRRENFSIRASNHSGFPDRSSVEAHQLAKLRALLAALLPNNPFCSGKFRAAGFHLNLGRLEEFFERVSTISNVPGPHSCVPLWPGSGDEGAV